MIDMSVISFEPLVGHVYHLYKKTDEYRLMMVSPLEWGREKAEALGYISSVRLLSDHTWEILDHTKNLFV